MESAKIDKLISDGKEIIKNPIYHDGVTKYYDNFGRERKMTSPSYNEIDEDRYASWILRVKNYIKRIFGENSDYYKALNESSPFEDNYDRAKKYIAILEGIRDNEEIADDDAKSNDSLYFIEKICRKFPDFVQQLQYRYDKRPIIDVADEYDVQYLLHPILKLFFEDIRAEEWTPSYAGSSCKMDFLLKQEKIVIETKMTRDTLKDKEVGRELLIDIAHYKEHNDVETMICFIYDPDRLIKNIPSLKDLEGTKDLNVKVYVVR